MGADVATLRYLFTKVATLHKWQVCRPNRQKFCIVRDLGIMIVYYDRLGQDAAMAR